MSDKKALLATKAHIRTIRPKFRRQKGHLKMRISRTSYRAPKGLQSKMGDNRAGHRSQIKTGFGYPKELRGLSRTGLILVHVESIAAANAVDAKTQMAIVSASLGTKKKIEVVKILSEKKAIMQNIKDPVKYLADSQASHASSKDAKLKEAQARAAKKDAALKAKQGKKVETKEAPAKDEAAVKADEKKENDKLLRQKGQ